MDASRPTLFVCSVPAPGKPRTNKWRHRLCEHGVDARQCRACGTAGRCKHGRKLRLCEECGNRYYCEHGRRRWNCLDCGFIGEHRCEHGKSSHRCRDCGRGYCEHGFRSDECKVCGKGRCQHGKRPRECRACRGRDVVARISGAGQAKSHVRRLLKSLGCADDYDIRQIVSDVNISNEQLEAIAGGNGYPDWEEEGLEEKRPGDQLRPAQWARAVLFYRGGKKYKVAYRFTSTKRKVFDTVFDFYFWQIGQAEPENPNGLKQLRFDFRKSSKQATLLVDVIVKVIPFKLDGPDTDRTPTFSLYRMPGMSMKSNHIRWHINRNVVSPTCDFCKQQNSIAA